MKILFTSHRFSPDIGGIEINSEILAKYFSSKGHDVRVLTQTRSVDNTDRKYRIYRKPSIIRMFRLYAWSDIVYQNNIEIGSLWPNIIYQKPYVVSIHTWIRNSKGKKRMVDYLKRFILNFANSVITVSNAVRIDSYQKSIVIGNPYRSNQFKVIDNIKRNQTVVYLGRFVSDKGVEMLIEAYSKLKLTNKPLTLIGSGPGKENYIKLATRVGVRLRFTGNLYGMELVKELNSHKILVVPSLWEEPFGNVALEGMACGCLVLASDGGGLTDAVGKAGLTFKRGCLEDLVSKMKMLYANNDIQKKIKENIENHLSNHLEHIVCEKYLKVLEGVYNEKKFDKVS